MIKETLLASTTMGHDPKLSSCEWYVPLPDPYERIFNAMIARVGWVMPVCGVGATTSFRTATPKLERPEAQR